MIAVRCDTCQAETDEDTAELLWLKVTPGPCADGSVRHEYHFCGWPCLGRGGPPRRPDVVAAEDVPLVVDLASALTEACDLVAGGERVEAWRALARRVAEVSVLTPGACSQAYGAAAERTFLTKRPHGAPTVCLECFLEMRDSKYRLEAEIARLVGPR